MKNIFYPFNHKTSTLTTGGFAAILEAAEYVNHPARRPENYILLRDLREAPNSTARAILKRTWGQGFTLTEEEHNFLLSVLHLEALPAARQPSDLLMALAAGGLLTQWEVDGKPKGKDWFLKIGH